MGDERIQAEFYRQQADPKKVDNGDKGFRKEEEEEENRQKRRHSQQRRKELMENEKKIMIRQKKENLGRDKTNMIKKNYLLNI